MVITPFPSFRFIFHNSSSPETGVLHLVVVKDSQALLQPDLEMSQIIDAHGPGQVTSRRCTQGMV